MKVMVVDDHPLMLDALKLALVTLGDSVEVETAHDLASAFECAARCPDIELTLLDLGLPDSAGIDALRRFRARLPDWPVVVVSGANDRDSILSALEAGAMGFIPKTSSREVLLSAVRLVASGGIYVPPEVLVPAPAQDALPAERPPPARAPDGVAVDGSEASSLRTQFGVSPREAEVLVLLLKGLQNKRIASRLGISENTVKNHVGNAFTKLGVASRTQALIEMSRLRLNVSERR